MTPTPSFPQEEFLAKWIAGELSAEEWEAWKSQAGDTDLEKIARITENWEVPARKSKAEAWTQIQARIEVEQPVVETPVRQLNENKRRRWPVWAASVAAALLIGLSFFLSNLSEPTVYQTGIGDKMTVNLPDGSTVTLNANSTLSLEEATFAENRALTLAGEAYFVVAKGQRFTVQTDRGTIAVLGTRFNVHDRPERWEVDCFEGKVAVSAAEQSLTLIAGQEAYLEKTQLVMSTEGEPETQLWNTDRSVFDNAPLVEVIAELERQYKIQISLPPELSPEERYTGGFPHNNLKNALNLVFETWNYLPILEDGGQVRLSLVQ